MKNRIHIFPIIILIFGIFACKDEIRIGVCISSPNSPVYRVMKQAFSEKSKEYGIRIIFRESLDKKTGKPSTLRESEQIQNMLRYKINALILHPADVDKSSSIIKKVRSRGIPVVTLDKLPRNVIFDWHIKISSRELGRRAAESAIEVLNTWYPLEEREREWNVIVLEGMTLNRTLREIVVGIYEILDQYQNEIQILASPQLASSDSAFESVNAMLSRYAGNVQAIIACTSEFSEGAVRAVRVHGLTYKPDAEKVGLENAERGIVTVGVGANKTACKLILDGEHVIEIDKMPYERAVLTLDTALEILKKQNLEADSTIHNGRMNVKVKLGQMRTITKYNIHLVSRMWPEIFEE